MFTLNCRGKIISWKEPVVMGIINATPDSFFEGHLPSGTANILERAGDMIGAGAAILDIGGQSTRPGSERIAAEEEISRVIPILTAIHERFPATLISVDTYHATVAKAAVDAGASIVNDISSGDMDHNMIPTVATLKVPFICMHMKGKPEHMQVDPQYANPVTELLDYFSKKVDACTRAGIHDCIIDPGFGFGKTAAHNLELLHNLSVFKILGKPLLAGLSRKATIYKTLGVTAAEALNGTTVLNTIALLNGASILRVHDAKEAREAIQLVQAYKKAASREAASS